MTKRTPDETWEWFEDKLTRHGFADAEELAAALNVGGGTVSRWRTQEAIPRGENLMKLMNIFEVSIEDLMIAIGQLDRGNENRVTFSS